MSIKKKYNLIIFLIIALLASFSFVYAASIDSTNKYAWSENFGWINFGTSQGGVSIGNLDLTGYVWAENIGWISLNCINTGTCGAVNYKVSNDGSGHLSGYAWSENAGWINFNAYSGTQVTIDTTTGDFSGWAWGENTGWISFNCSNTSSCGTISYKVGSNYGSSGSDGSGGGGGGPSIGPQPSQTPVPVTTNSPTPAPTGTPALTATPAPSATPSSTPPAPTPSPSETPFVEPPTGTPPPVFPPEPPQGGGGGGGVSLPPVVSQTVTNVVNQVQSVVQSIADTNVGHVLLETHPIPIPKKVQENSQRIINKIPGAAPAVSVATTAAATTSTLSLLSLLSTASNFGDYLWYLGFSLMEFIYIKRKGNPWGTVYDSVTKKPIAFAKVQILNKQLEVVETQITDKEGRYGFLVAPNSIPGDTTEIKLQVSKKNYSFPSVRVHGPADSEIYDHVYNGDFLQVLDYSTANFDIPLDPLDISLYGRRTAYSVKLRAGISKVFDNSVWVAFAFAPIQYLAAPHLLNFLMLSLVLILLGFRIAGVHQKPFGLTKDKEGFIIPFVLLILRDQLGQRAGFTVSDDRGRYFLLTKKGDYQLTANSPAGLGDARSTTVPISSKQGWITESIVL